MNAIGQEEIYHQIDFTGNWFIDIGILGFIRLHKFDGGCNREEIKNDELEGQRCVHM